MAISAPHAALFQLLPLPRGGSLLEIGEANWHGDVAPDFPCSDTNSLFAIAKSFYADVFAPSRNVAVDINGSPEALRQDLNGPLDLGGEQFDVVINHGTAEHVFHVAQVFRTMHDHCIEGGLMVHEAPFVGWIDHGFYCLQPTLFYDLAAANRYEIVLAAMLHIDSGSYRKLDSRDHARTLAKAGEVPNDTNLFLCFRKICDRPFMIPMQGYYARTLSPDGMKAWEDR